MLPRHWRHHDQTTIGGSSAISLRWRPWTSGSTHRQNVTKVLPVGLGEERQVLNGFNSEVSKATALDEALKMHRQERRIQVCHLGRQLRLWRQWVAQERLRQTRLR